MSAKRPCRWCGNALKGGEYAAFCPANPNADANRTAWRAGDKRFRFVRSRRVTIGPVIVLR